MWNHQCKEDGSMEIGEGEECSWCGCTEAQEPVSVKFVPQDLSVDPND